ncbi:MAG: histidinol dehydrogenase [Phycisphaerales bacterium]
MKTAPLLRRVTAAEITRLGTALSDRETHDAADAIVAAVQNEGETAVRRYAEKFEERRPGEPLVLGRAEMQRALDALDVDDRSALERAALRIEHFTQAQRSAISELTIRIPGGEAGHTIEPVESAGCYAPAGRYPLPSSVLMTAITARVAGCARVVVASPGAHPVALAAAAIADADEFLAVGGPHAIAAMAYGFAGFPRCDVIAGPGNKWVTAAKHIVSSVVGIDMLAGPSELLVLADETADAACVAADLLAQAEHDVDAVPMLITTSQRIADAVEAELCRQLEVLATESTARQALARGFVHINAHLEACIKLVDALAPEHLEVMTENATEVAGRIRNAGAMFIGPLSAEVVGDYGAGPNHTLPTGGSARFRAGLSVMHFIRLRTWMRIDDATAAQELFEDTHRLATIEGLAGHAVSVQQRIGPRD